MNISRDSVQENSYVANQIVVVSNAYMDIEYNNSVLRAQLISLREKLHSLNSIIEMSEGAMADVFLMNPWQMCFSSQPTFSSADIFEN
ncbi:unnamed protein product [Eruca vesicaria subsp. sativa]|uniref:Uncharacterized protein n=1 Tax=Eruca vesicaria subsp. sativa TaxID=29727 RepID=A0ABC8M238_ERUVS|nr:unnamed protein product [Eruca vesicaria subsp. sativa]